MSARLKVLIVEEEEVLAEDLYVFLRLSACDVRLAASGASAIGIAEDFTPDLLIVDEHPQGLSGLQTIRAIRSRSPQTECILLADRPTATARAAEVAECCDVVVKPLAFNALRAAVRRGASLPDGVACLQ